MNRLKNWLSRCLGNKQAGPTDKNSPLRGGSGLTVECPVVVNCASISLANRLIDSFVSEKHGKLDADWDHQWDSFVKKENVRDFSVRRVVIEDTSGVVHTYYFDISRPMSASKKLFDALSS